MFKPHISNVTNKAERVRRVVKVLGGIFRVVRGSTLRSMCLATVMGCGSEVLLNGVCELD